MFDPTTLVWCASGDVVLSNLISNMGLEHVIVRPIGNDSYPRDYEYRHSKVVPNAVQTGMGTTVTVKQGNKNYTLTCSRRTRLWLEMPKESWVAVTDVEVGDNITIFNGLGNSANGIGSVISVTDVNSITGQQIEVVNETNIALAVYASSMLVSIPY